MYCIARGKAVVCTILCVSLYVVLSASEYTIAPQTTHIYHRYYIIERLTDVMRILRTHEAISHLAYHELDPSLYDHAAIKAAVRVMQDHQSCEALYAMWDEIIQYQHVYDDAYIYAYTQLVLDICSALASRLPTVHSYIRSIRAIDLRDHTDRVTTDNIADRFYHTKRLDKAMRLLEHVQQQEIDTRALEHELDTFEHPAIQESLLQMCMKKNLTPLVALCQQFKQFRFMQDDQFLQEMLMQIFLVYKSLLFNAISDDYEQIVVAEMDHVMHVYEQVDQVPLDDTLEAIDEVTDRLYALQHMQHKKRLTLKSMIYVAAGIAGAVALLGVGGMLYAW